MLRTQELYAFHFSLRIISPVTLEMWSRSLGTDEFCRSVRVTVVHIMTVVTFVMSKIEKSSRLSLCFAHTAAMTLGSSSQVKPCQARSVQVISGQVRSSWVKLRSYFHRVIEQIFALITTLNRVFHVSQKIC